MYFLVVLYNYFIYGSYIVNLIFINFVNKRICLLNIFVYKFVYFLIGFNIICFFVNLFMLIFCMLDVMGGNDFWCDWDFGVNS